MLQWEAGKQNTKSQPGRGVKITVKNSFPKLYSKQICTTCQSDIFTHSLRKHTLLTLNPYAIAFFRSTKAKNRTVLALLSYLQKSSSYTSSFVICKESQRGRSTIEIEERTRFSCQQQAQTSNHVSNPCLVLSSWEEKGKKRERSGKQREGEKLPSN